MNRELAGNPPFSLMPSRPDSAFVVGWGTLALINANLAQAKRRSGLGWFTLSKAASARSVNKSSAVIHSRSSAGASLAAYDFAGVVRSVRTGIGFQGAPANAFSLCHFAWCLMAALRSLRHRSLAFAGAALCGVSLRAQPIERSVALGVVLPAGDYSQFRTIGPAVRAGVAFGDPDVRRVRLRVEFEAAWLLSRGARSGFANSDPGSLTAMSLLASGVFGRRPREGFAPYLITGIAIQSLTIPGQRNPYGSTFGLRVGAGIQRRVARRQYFGEIAPHLALTDFGAGSDFGTAAYVPIVVGLRF